MVWVVFTHHLSLNREGRWGTTVDFTTSSLHFSLFSSEWSTISVCHQCVLVLCAFLTGAILKGQILRKQFCLVFVCVCFLYIFVSGLILLFLDNLWFDHMRAGLKKKEEEDRLNIVFRLDVILCG